jgi:hypothetical protein
LGKKYSIALFNLLLTFTGVLEKKIINYLVSAFCTLPATGVAAYPTKV